MKALIFYEFGTEIVEFFAPIDVLHRAGIFTEIASGLSEASEHIPSLTRVVDNKTMNININNDINNDKYDVIIIPGGKLGVQTLETTLLPYKEAIIKYFNRGKLLAAICAAPSLLGKMGILKGQDYTCYPGWQSDSFGGNYLNQGVVRSENLITGRSMYYSSDFGLEIVEYLLGKEKRIEIENQIKGIH